MKGSDRELRRGTFDMLIKNKIEAIEIPALLVLPNSAVRVSYEENVFYNRTRNSILIEGTRAGFLSLANSIFFLLNDLQDVFYISSLPFVKADLQLKVECDDRFEDSPGGRVERVQGDEFLLRTTDRELSNTASLIHSLGYVNNELHLDGGKMADEISIYCVVDAGEG